MARMRPDHVRGNNPTPYKVSVTEDFYRAIEQLYLQEMSHPKEEPAIGGDVNDDESSDDNSIPISSSSSSKKKI
jgi:hypothetical protein